MSTCKQCGQCMQYRRDFCKETCQQAYFAEREPVEVEEDEENLEEDENGSE